LYCSFFKRELERERDPFRRNLIEIQLREVEEKIEDLKRLEAIQLMRDIQFMKNALEKLDKK
jgi:hypothetical protein